MINFFVPGIPRPGGSKTTGFNKKTGKRFVRDANKHTKPWKQQVSYFAEQYYDGPLLNGALKLDIVFIMPRPKHHYGTGRNAGILKPSAPRYHTTEPDSTKLTRSTEDALKGIIWRDDSLVAKQSIEKIYGEKPGAEIKIELLPDDHCRIESYARQEALL